MLDLSAMRAVWVDPMARIARVQGGALWADVDRETCAFGLATTGGVISTTGVAGLTLGGGIGWLVGKHGMSIDNLLAVDLVTADGEFVTASPKSHPDLFWAVRGGGGNFGVATSFDFRLHPQGDVLAGFVAYPVARAREVLSVYQELTATAPEELGAYGVIGTDAESEERIAVIIVCWPGDPVEGRRVLEPLRQLGEPLVEMIGPTPYPDWQRTFDFQWPHSRRYYWKGNLLRDLPDALLDAVVEHASTPPLPGMVAAFEWYRGPMNRVGPNETAFAHRDARYQLVIAGGWDEPVDDGAGIGWVRGLHGATEPFALNGTFLTFNALDAGDRLQRVRAGYGSNWARLVEIKRRYDPQNRFRENNNITP
jgi:FAD/FMN-containing dehydrogenase